MNHIDEGTIHAWLDGALSAERAREVEVHVAQCPTCSSAVAEARGLIAGASRILTALDDVPANVTPKRAPAPAPLKRQRQWRAAPWVTGIAAALILAIGVTTWNRDGGRMMRSEVVTPAIETDSMKATAAIGTDSVRATAEAAQSPGGTAAGGAANVGSAAAKAAPTPTVPSASKRSVARQRSLAAREEAAAPTRKLDVAPAAPSAMAEGRVAGVVPTIDTAVTRRRGSGFAAASADTTRSRNLVRSSDTTRLRTTSQARLQLDEVVVTGTGGGANVARDSAAVRQVAGCYQLVPIGERTGVAKLTERVAAAAAPPSDASRRAAPAPALTRADLADTRVPSRVRLDTTQNRAGFMVRDESTDGYLGTWQRVGDSVRVTLPAHGTFMMAAKARVSCPER